MRNADDFLSYIGIRFGDTGTGKSYRRAIASLERVTGKSDPASITVRDLDDWMRATKGALADSTRNRHAFAVRSFFRFLKSRGYILTDPCADFVPPISKRPGFSVLTPEEIQSLVAATPPTKKFRAGPFGDRSRQNYELAGVRDRALVVLIYVAALRAGDAGKIALTDFTPTKGGANLKVLGKWHTEPTVLPVDAQTTAMILVWIQARRDAGIVSPWLFCPLTGDPARPLSYTALAAAFDRRVEAAGISRRGRGRLTLHTLRRSRATHLSDAGEPTLKIARVLRSGVANVENYVRRIAPDRSVLASVPWISAQLPV